MELPKTIMERHFHYGGITRGFGGITRGFGGCTEALREVHLEKKEDHF